MTRLVRPVLASPDSSARRLTDAAFWQPFVREALRRHDLPIGELAVNRPGTHPTFVSAGRHAVKLYADLPEAERDVAREIECSRLVAQAGDIPAPRLLAAGQLFDDGAGWPWPYLITTAVPGVSFAQAEPQMARGDVLRLAEWLGQVVRRLHDLPLGGARLLRADWSAYAAATAAGRRDETTALGRADGVPAWVLEELDEFVGPPATWFDPAACPVLVHGDLHEDHILLAQRDGRWEPTGIVDFGDALVGDWTYELPCVSLATFDADRAAFSVFLDSYGPSAQQYRDLPRRALRALVLHRFMRLANQFRHHPPLAHCRTLDEVAEALFGFDRLR